MIQDVEKITENLNPRDLSYPLYEYYSAPSSTYKADRFSLAYTWSDKPHRLLYDLVAKVIFDDKKITKLQEKCDEQSKRIEELEKLLKEADVIVEPLVKIAEELNNGLFADHALVINNYYFIDKKLFHNAKKFKDKINES